MLPEIPLHLTIDGVPVCDAHVRPYLDDPLTAVDAHDYHTWFLIHGSPMRCARCQGVTDDGERPTVGDDFLGANRSAWGDRDADGLEAPLDLSRAFSTYLDHPSYAV